jgi:multicomponent Na+:H+ antiporter subunit E
MAARSPMAPPGAPIRLWLTTLAVRLAAGTAGWLALTGEFGSMRYGIPVVAALVAMSLLLLPPRPRLPLWRVPLLLPWLFWESLRGGVDVALRAARPNMPLEPALIDIPLGDTDRRMRIALAYVLTLLPGTLAAKVGRDRIELHVIDRGMPTQQMARRLRRRLQWALALEEVI